MRLRDFRTLMDDEFGPAYAASIARDQSLTSLGGRTPDQAMADGIELREIWLALCEAMDVPPERRLGTDPARRARH